MHSRGPPSLPICDPRWPSQSLAKLRTTPQASIKFPFTLRRIAELEAYPARRPVSMLKAIERRTASAANRADKPVT